MWWLAAARLVLRPAGDGPLARGLRHVLAHRQPCARLGVLRDRRHEVPRAETPSARSRSPVVRALLKASSDCRRPSLTATGASEAESVPPAMPDSIWPRATLLATRMVASRPVPQACCTSKAGVVAAGTRAQHRLPGEVVVAAVLEDGAGHDLPDPLAGQAVAGDQPLERRGQHLLVARAGIGAVGAGEGDPVATDDGGATLR